MPSFHGWSLLVPVAGGWVREPELGGHLVAPADEAGEWPQFFFGGQRAGVLGLACSCGVAQLGPVPGRRVVFPAPPVGREVVGQQELRPDEAGIAFA